MTDINRDRRTDVSPAVEICAAYQPYFFKAFLDFHAQPSDFDRFMGVSPGSFDDALHIYAIYTSPTDISKALHYMFHKENNLAIRLYNICLEASSQGIDPTNWYEQIRPEIKAHIELVASVKELEQLKKHKFDKLARSIVRNSETGLPAKKPGESLKLQREYIEARHEYQKAFDRMWLNLITLDGAK